MSSDAGSQNYPSFFWHHERTDQTTTGSKILLTAIVSLSFIVLLVSILHIYARCVLRRQARRRAAMRQMRIITAAHYQVPGEPPSRGLNPAVAASLPKYAYKRRVESEPVSTDCSVCLSSVEEGETVRKLPNCGHVFHAECIDKWLESQSTCPVCRTGAEPKPGVLIAVQPEPRESAIGVPVSVGPTAPPLDGGGGSARITGGSSSFGLGSFRKIWEHRSSNRGLQVGSNDECGSNSVDLERQSAK